MTKDWDAVQDEIRELSFNQKRCLEDVKALMERKYKFRASTRAYRMKLKEWGLMRHKARGKTGMSRSMGEDNSRSRDSTEEQDERQSSATVEPMSVVPTPVAFSEKQGGWQVVPEPQLAEAEPTFMGMLHQTPSFPPFDPLAQASTRAKSIVMDMLGAVLENDATKLEKLILENENHVNDPIGLPFETHSSPFFGHPVMNEMVIMQHPDQTLMDIACGMPCGPVVWVLQAHGGKGSRHPYGTDLAFHNAIKNARTYTVQSLLSTGRSDVNGLPGTSWTPILQSVFWNHPEVFFIKPWQVVPSWATSLSTIELDCLRLFVSKGANLDAQFEGYPCSSIRRSTFLHQVLWHSTPSIARVIVDAYSSTTSNSGARILHEILGSCPDAKRHPADTLRDIQVLLQAGVDPNVADDKGISPMRKCIEQCPAVDLVPRLQMLLDAGANPEAEDGDGIQPFVLAARTFEEPLLSEVMQALHFPIGGTQSYEQVMSCSRNTGDFRLELLDMVSADIQEAFQRAYFSVVSQNFLDTMTITAKARMLTPNDKNKIAWIINMRKGLNLPDFKFDQELVIALLDPQPVLEMPPSSSEVKATETSESTNSASAPARWQFNPNNTNTSTSPRRDSASTHKPDSDSEMNDFIVPPTTLIRWYTPDKAPKPGDAEKARNSVLQYHCGTCDDGVPLTKGEQEKHGVEHAHTSTCDAKDCERRFCLLRRKRRSGNTANGHTVGCQDHLFAGGV
ncbi:hypothetical protein FB567DRAFT_452537 [Paraphoma chrysanthemicola]|uniref:Clr5 domain-containing protein n=1 Tax=Paraphoma chrysanthemicola TaxID=798071 RepID=A0A8K0QZF8_9PLEO|nr:hypothetical protein FB567DRAFT_452537 [Paraphoma chrysanthemicola]